MAIPKDSHCTIKEAARHIAFDSLAGSEHWEAQPEFSVGETFRFNCAKGDCLYRKEFECTDHATSEPDPETGEIIPLLETIYRIPKRGPLNVKGLDAETARWVRDYYKQYKAKHKRPDAGRRIAVDARKCSRVGDRGKISAEWSRREFARKELQTRGEAGELDVYGRLQGAGRLQHIPEIDFVGAFLRTIDNTLLPCGRHSRTAPKWEDLRIKYKQVLELWPAPPQEVEHPDERRRKRNKAKDDAMRNRIQNVLASAERTWSSPKNRPSFNTMPSLLLEIRKSDKIEGFGEESIRKILRVTTVQ